MCIFTPSKWWWGWCQHNYKYLISIWCIQDVHADRTCCKAEQITNPTSECKLPISWSLDHTNRSTWLLETAVNQWWIRKDDFNKESHSHRHLCASRYCCNLALSKSWRDCVASQRFATQCARWSMPCSKDSNCCQLAQFSHPSKTWILSASSQTRSAILMYILWGVARPDECVGPDLGSPV